MAPCPSLEANLKKPLQRRTKALMRLSRSGKIVSNSSLTLQTIIRVQVAPRSTIARYRISKQTAALSSQNRQKRSDFSQATLDIRTTSNSRIMKMQWSIAVQG